MEAPAVIADIGSTNVHEVFAHSGLTLAKMGALLHGRAELADFPFEVCLDEVESIRAS